MAYLGAGIGPIQSIKRNNKPHPAAKQRLNRAMLKNSTTREDFSWPPSPATPLSGVDCPVVQAGRGNHGAIGDKRNIRPSTVFSGGFIPNTKGSSCLQPQNRQSAVATPQLQIQVDQPAGPKCDSVLVEAHSLTDDQLTQSVPAMEGARSRKSSEAHEQVAGKLDKSNPSGIMGSQAKSYSPKNGESIKNPISTTTSFQLPCAPQEGDLQKLMSKPIFSASHFVTGVNQDMQQMGDPARFNYSSGSVTVTMPTDADLQTPLTNCSGGPYQTGFDNSGTSSGQPSPHLFAGQAEENRSKSNIFYSSQGVAMASVVNNATGFSSSRQGSDVGQPGNFQNSQSQDFCLTPRPDQWNEDSSYMTGSVHKKVTCMLCNENYRWPHALECLHVYCFQCITMRFDREDKSIVCPECTHVTRVQDGPCSLKLDHQCARFMRLKGIFPFNCTSCTREKEAVTCCTTCSDYLCSDCQDGHLKMNHFQAHTLSPITKTGKCADGDYTIFCKRDPSQPVTRYCCVCACVVCQSCYKDHLHPENHPESKKDNCPLLEEVFPIFLGTLRISNEDAQIKAKDMAEMAHKHTINKHYLDKKGRECMNQIEDYAKYLMTVVDQNRVASLELLESTMNQLERESMEWMATVNKTTKQLQVTASFNTRTVEDSSNAEIIDLVATMESAYMRSVQQYDDAVKDNQGVHTFDIKFAPNYTESHDALNKGFQAIYYLNHGVQKKVDPSICNQPNGAISEKTVSHTEISNHGYKGWTATSNAAAIGTWINMDTGVRKIGTFIPSLKRSRTKMAHIHIFGEKGNGQYSFTEPSGQAYFKDGSYVICDTNNHRVVHFSAKHEYLRTIGQPRRLQPMAEGQDQRLNGHKVKLVRQDRCLFFPNRVAICPISQNIIVTERSPSHDIQIFSVSGEFLRCFAGNILQHPRGVAVDEHGTIIVVECQVMKLSKYTQDGTLTAIHSLHKNVEFPNDIAVRNYKIFISDNRVHCVHVVNYNAELLYKIGDEHITFFPIGVSINHIDQVVVTDNHNTFNITVFSMTGDVLYLFESVGRLDKCHSVSVNPNNFELMLTTKDCCVYHFDYDPDKPHSLTPPAGQRYVNPNRRLPGNRNGNGNALL